MELWNCGIGSGIVELWNLGIVELWNYEIMELWNYGIVELWNYGIMELKCTTQCVSQFNSGITNNNDEDQE